MIGILLKLRADSVILQGVAELSSDACEKCL